MSRLGRLGARLGQLSRLGAGLGRATLQEDALPACWLRCSSPEVLNHSAASSWAWRGLQTSSAPFASGEVIDLEHATGLEREEMEGRLQGKNIFHEDWLDAPFGTVEKPVEVPSDFSERIVGVPDLEDDSIVWWGSIVDGEPPKQIVPGGEYFVLKRSASGSGHGGH